MIIRIADGLEVEVDVPAGAVVTNAVVTLAYEGIDGDAQHCSGTAWGCTAMAYPTLVGMQRLTQINMEKGARQ